MVSPGGGLHLNQGLPGNFIHTEMQGLPLTNALQRRLFDPVRVSLRFVFSGKRAGKQGFLPRVHSSVVITIDNQTNKDGFFKRGQLVNVVTCADTFLDDPVRHFDFLTNSFFQISSSIRRVCFRSKANCASCSTAGSFPDCIAPRPFLYGVRGTTKPTTRIFPTISGWQPLQKCDGVQGRMCKGRTNTVFHSAKCFCCSCNLVPCNIGFPPVPGLDLDGFPDDIAAFLLQFVNP